MREVGFTLNGASVAVPVRPQWTLLHLLREQLRLKGTKEGCGVGVCGTCTVLIDGRPVSSCLTLAANVAGREIVTIEGLGGDGHLDPVQQAFLESTAFQCGFCTAGMIMATKALLATAPGAGDDEARDFLAGNLCRCGTYTEVLQAVRRARELAGAAR